MLVNTLSMADQESRAPLRCGKPIQKRLNQCGFTNTCLPGHEAELALAGSGCVQQFLKASNLLLAPE